MLCYFVRKLLQQKLYIESDMQGLSRVLPGVQGIPVTLLNKVNKALITEEVTRSYLKPGRVEQRLYNQAFIYGTLLSMLGVVRQSIPESSGQNLEDLLRLCDSKLVDLERTLEAFDQVAICEDGSTISEFLSYELLGYNRLLSTITKVQEMVKLVSTKNAADYDLYHIIIKASMDDCCKKQRILQKLLWGRDIKEDVIVRC
ncbi:hypothetical protein [Ehrlichia ruminantium]|uniref:hypothetical protein n=1 Tax=Ehrlichia ruminantium TaxID=779 RepID=UPI00130EE223|nr:hypothetical protein [Ehrlichia ruminantium]